MYRIAAAILILVFTLSPLALLPVPVEAAAQWVNVEIDPSKVPGDLTDFIVYVDLSDLPTDFTEDCTTGGGDIRVFKSDGTTELAREVVSADMSVPEGELHLLYSGTTSGSATTSFQIHCDGTSSDYATSATYGAENVWSDYLFVSHDGGDGDSSGNVTTTNNGSVDETSNVAIGANARYFTADYYSTDLNLRTEVGTGDFTAQTWFNINAINSRRQFIGVSNSTSAYQDAFTLSAGNAADGGGYRVRTGARAGTSGQVDIYSGAGYQDNNWHLIHGTRTGTTGELFVDGGSEGSTTDAEFGVDLGQYMQVGRVGPFDTMTGYLDEIRVRASQLSSDWITTEYNNQSSPSTFYWVSAEQTAGGGGGNTDRKRAVQVVYYRPELITYTVLRVA